MPVFPLGRFVIVDDTELDAGQGMLKEYRDTVGQRFGVIGLRGAAGAEEDILLGRCGRRRGISERYRLLSVSFGVSKAILADTGHIRRHAEVEIDGSFLIRPGISVIIVLIAPSGIFILAHHRIGRISEIFIVGIDTKRITIKGSDVFGICGSALGGNNRSSIKKLDGFLQDERLASTLDSSGEGGLRNNRIVRSPGTYSAYSKHDSVVINLRVLEVFFTLTGDQPERCDNRYCKCNSFHNHPTFNG